MNKPNIVTFEISDFEDRQNVIVGLANAGYKVWCTDTQRLLEARYFVHVEMTKGDGGE